LPEVWHTLRLRGFARQRMSPPEFVRVLVVGVILSTVNVFVDANVTDINGEQLGHLGGEETAAQTHLLDLL